MMASPFLGTTSLTNITNFPYLLWYLMTAPPFILPAKPDVQEIHVVEYEKAFVPCKSVLEYRNDTITLIFLYKDNYTSPIYTVDSRKSTLEKARHFKSSEIKSRAHFNVLLDVPALVIDEVLVTDSGTYKCRTEFAGSPTMSSSCRLQVIVPPTHLHIFDERGLVVSGKVGPYEEGDNITLTCVSNGGVPSPIVTWWRESMLVGSSYVSTDDGSVINELTLTNLRRDQSEASYTCISSNTNLSLPLTSSVIIDMHLEPLEVEILSPTTDIKDGSPYEVVCQTKGSKPPATLFLSIDDKELLVRNGTEGENSTVLSAVLVASSEDDGKTLSCRATNFELPNKVIETRINLSVLYRPRLRLVPGAGVNMEKVKEGTDVYFECTVKSNPEVEEVKWFSGRVHLFTNISAGVIAQKRTLVLRNLSREQSGPYQCNGINVMGEGWSDPVFLRVRYAPVCKQFASTSVGLSVNDTVEIDCPIDADPFDVSFTWHLRNVYGNFTLNSSSHSILYSPSSKQDYGILCCRGSNSVGLQKSFCCMTVTPDDVPPILQNCSFSALSPSFLSVSCHINTSPIGSKQTFHLEVYNQETKELQVSLSREDAPVFTLREIRLSSKLLLVIYTSNGRRRSPAINLTVESTDVLPLDLQTEQQEKSKEYSFFQWISEGLSVVGISCFLIALTVIVCIAFKKRRHRKKDRLPRSSANTRNDDLADNHGLSQATNSPDLIPKDADSTGSSTSLSKTLELEERLSHVENALDLVEERFANFQDRQQKRVPDRDKHVKESLV